MTTRSAEPLWAEQSLAIVFRDPGLLSAALTHKSAGSHNYERLEFLGDRVLGLIVAEWVMTAFPDEHEGKLTRRFHQLVSRESCARIARRIGAADVVRLGAQARMDGGAQSDNILGDVMEALIGAVYIDQGLDAARTLVRRLWDDAGSVEDAPKHPKMRLQEWAAAHNLKVPNYRLVARVGPDHSPRFRVALAIASFPEVTAEGHSKQDAETLAASMFLDSYAG